MSESGEAKAVIEKFIREELGCTCPDEVFDSIQLEKNPAAFSDLLQGNLLAIGGRLLVYLVETDDLTAMVTKLGPIVRRGREKRDGGGFNRFRLVVCVPDTRRARQLLPQQFNVLREPDEKLHLHIIAPDQLPALLAC